MDLESLTIDESVILGIHKDDLVIELKLAGSLSFPRDCDFLWVSDHLSEFAYLNFILPIKGLHIDCINDSEFLRTIKANKNEMVTYGEYAVQSEFQLDPNFWITILDEFGSGFEFQNWKALAVQFTAQDGNFELNWVGKCDDWEIIHWHIKPEHAGSAGFKVEVFPTNGFHSNLHITANAPAHFDLNAIGYISRDFIVDPYEIKQINFEDGITVSVYGAVDLEVSADSPKAEPHLLFVKILKERLVDDEVDLIVPFHLRYQKPLENAYKDIRFSKPLFFHSVPKEEYNCPKGLIPRLLRQQTKTNNSCIIFESFDFEQKFSVPVGNIELENFITTYTYIIVILGAVLIGLSLHFRQKKVKLDRKKLN